MNNILMTFSENLRRIRIERGLTQEQLALACNWGQSRIANYESRGRSAREPSLNDIETLARALSVTKAELIGDATTGYVSGSAQAISKPVELDTYEIQAIDDDEELDTDINVWVEEVDITLSAGSGVLIPEFIGTKRRMPFPLSWFRTSHIRPGDVKLMRVHGDSMEHTLFDNDWVLVNFADTRIRDGKVYAIAIGGEAKVKRLYTLRNNSLRIVSDNQNRDSEGHRVYKDEIVPLSEMDTIQVLGRVVSRGGGGGI
ncbi:XRE family transcriptional regulator [Xylella fastidiosa]|uniref:XRE family transcriptional regulator n=2 Tax=Xylella fastidiosa TaxID=2371 RepID=UPI001F340196|nr:XRE family transcriptional regulator [Xylella fastidiosa]